MRTRLAVAALAATGVATSGLMAPPAGAAMTGGTAASTPAVVSAAETGRQVTNFGLGGSAYATRFKGGDSPAQSGRTAWSYLGCTRLAGVAHTNRLIEVDPMTSGDTTVQASGARSRVFSTKNGDVVASHGRSSVSSLKLGNGTDSLTFKGLLSTTRTWHDKRGFHKEASSSFASADLNGVPVVLPPGGEELEIPGLATVKFFSDKGRVTKRHASATADAVRIELADGGVLNVARAHSRIDAGLISGVLGGRGIAVEGTLAGGTVKTGRIANQPLSCQGTDGKTKDNTLAGVDLGGAVLSGLQGTARGDQLSPRRAYGVTSGRVGKFSAGNGELVVRGIVGVAKVVKRNGKLKRMTESTSIASITVGGEEVDVPPPGQTLVIPGVAKLIPSVIKRLRYGISITALKVVTFADTEGENVFELGQASTRISPR